MNEFRLENFDELADVFARAPKTVAKFLGSSMEQAVSLLHYRVSDKTPIGVGNAGHLATSIQTDVTTLTDSVIGAVGTNKPYGEAVELGTKPHMPPIQPLFDWCQVVLGLDEDKAQQVAFLIAMKIKHKGTEGKFMFRDSFEESEQQIEAMFNQARAKILESMSNV